MRDDLLNPELFGNEAGEDENKRRLNEYYLEKEKIEYFMMLIENWVLLELEKELENQLY